ncbi:MAG: hypothetical protein IKZ07_06005 [Akkermansia sp.]|nr:hypothetical protein [Akkermansia sp.]
MKQTIKQQKAGMEMLCQKAGNINRELDKKCEKLEQWEARANRIAADVKALGVHAFNHAFDAGRACREAQSAARFAMWMASAALVFLLGMICVLFVI